MPKKDQKVEQKDQPKTKNAAAKSNKKPKVKLPSFIPMWAVIDNDYPDDPVTFVSTYDEAIMALDQYLYLKHYTHFRQWCPLHGYKVDHSKAWLAYSKTVLREEYIGSPLYTIVQINYEPNVIASLLRAYNHCTPMGLPFDTPEEIDEFATRMEELPESELTPLEKSLSALFDDIDNDEVAEAAEIKSHCPVYDKPLDKSNKKEDKKYDA